MVKWADWTKHGEAKWRELLNEVLTDPEHATKEELKATIRALLDRANAAPEEANKAVAATQVEEEDGRKKPKKGARPKAKPLPRGEAGAKVGDVLRQGARTGSIECPATTTWGGVPRDAERGW